MKAHFPLPLRPSLQAVNQKTPNVASDSPTLQPTFSHRESTYTLHLGAAAIDRSRLTGVGALWPLVIPRCAPWTL